MHTPRTGKKFYDYLEIPRENRLELSNGWLMRFQKRHQLKFGEAASVPVQKIEPERKRIRCCLISEYSNANPSEDAYNETLVVYACDHGLTRHPTAGMKQIKTRSTLTVNATGTHRPESVQLVESNNNQSESSDKDYPKPLQPSEVFKALLLLETYWQENQHKDYNEIIRYTKSTRKHIEIN